MRVHSHNNAQFDLAYENDNPEQLTDSCSRSRRGFLTLGEWWGNAAFYIKLLYYGKDDIPSYPIVRYPRLLLLLTRSFLLYPLRFKLNS